MPVCAAGGGRSGEWSMIGIRFRRPDFSGATEHRPPTTALQLNRGHLSKSEDHAGDDQVGALDLRAAVCAVRSVARRGRLASVAATRVDYSRDGFGALGGDDL